MQGLPYDHYEEGRSLRRVNETPQFQSGLFFFLSFNLILDGSPDSLVTGFQRLFA